MKPRSKVCFIGQLISQKKHFHLSFYNLGLDFFREDRDDLVEIIINYTKMIKKIIHILILKDTLSVTLCLKALAFQYPVLELMLFWLLVYFFFFFYH